MPIDGESIRRILLEVVDEQHRMAADSGGRPSLQQVSLLREATQRLGRRLSLDEEQALLTAWYDLFRTGHLSWGYNLNNPDPPFCHVTEHGRRALSHFSRDPSNSDGYLLHLRQRATVNVIAQTYIDEALGTYNVGRFRATAVMVGAASESLVLELRDSVVEGLKCIGRNPSKDLADWRMKRVLDGLQKEIEMQKAAFVPGLFEEFEAYWPAFVQQIRAVRNDAGHPASIDPVTPDIVHASLLIFPELARLTTKLLTSVRSNYQ
jgi:hypothetical protein